MFSLLLNILAYSPSTSAWNEATCTFPSPCWPSDNTWKSLNNTLRGSLYRAHPPAAPCHVPYTNEAACGIAKQNWTSQFWRAQQPGGYQDVAWENGDSYCNIDNDPNTPCAQGLVPQYVAKVQNVDDVKAAVNFARQHKLNTRVKGASHDYLGRSSGNGTFGISTIDLKGIQFEDNFTLNHGSARSAAQSVVHIGAGEHWYYVYKAADARGVSVVGGASYSVGAAGGWVLGGGHSALSPQYGLGVDNVIQFEIVTPDGKLRTANQYENKDLFWALRGGGPGFGVVTKVTYKTHPAIPAIVALLMNVTYTNASYHGALKTFLSMQPDLAAHNFSGYMYPSNTNLLAELLVANSADLNGANATLKPLFDFAEAETTAGRPMLVQTMGYVVPSVFSMFPDDPATVNEGSGSAAILGSRLVPLDIFKGARLEAFTTFLVKQPFISILHLVAGGKVSTVSPSATAVHPSWRRASHHIVLASGWETNTTFALRNQIRSGLTQVTQGFAALVPGFGAYTNEADINEPKWSETFWGSNYPRLVSIKRNIDPLGIFTCYHCVGYQD
ncbi:hypothetical protein FRC20_008979 [Serendipita sp. 405]|nr:hypothetical protein FRC20_008979 [Serendipita sp. 405]